MTSPAHPLHATGTQRRQRWLTASLRPIVSIVPLVMGAALLASGAACEVKVPIVDVGAQFTVADATWFEEEATLFVFYRVDALQGLSERSQIEVAFRTDEVDQDFAALETFAPVHPHVAADCGRRAICGSYSIEVGLPPRDVRMRLRYHEDGPLTLDAPLAANLVFAGPPHQNRSAVVYGVFDEPNRRIQWRLRHTFPAVRNEDATALGLRREFTVERPAFGSFSAEDLVAVLPENPYLYGLAAACPPGFDASGGESVTTTERAVFAAQDLPLAASTSAHVCAVSTVSDARGRFTVTATAQKNPQVAPALSQVTSPVEAATVVPFFFQVCDDVVDEGHRQLQLQRLLLDEADVVCVDDFATAGFAARLSQRMQEAIDVERAVGDDMVLLIGLNRRDDNELLAGALEAALAEIVTGESNKSSPRLGGAFVYDSVAHSVSDPEVARLALWCPSGFGGDDLDAVDDVSARDCAVQLNQELRLGPVRVASLPIFPTRPQFLTFIETYSDTLLGRTRSLTFRVPSQTAVSENVSLGEFGTATFFNNEAVSAEPTDAFSFCADEAAGGVVIRVADVAELNVPLPLAVLPDLHAQFPQSRYALGLAWDAPYLLELRYESQLAGAAQNVPLINTFAIPFGPAVPSESFFGGFQWAVDSVDLSDVLLRCSRFCGHPTFDSAGVYNVRVLFAESFRNQCYTPRFPVPGDGGFPLDP